MLRVVLHKVHSILVLVIALHKLDDDILLEVDIMN